MRRHNIEPVEGFGEERGAGHWGYLGLGLQCHTATIKPDRENAVHLRMQYSSNPNQAHEVCPKRISKSSTTSRKSYVRMGTPALASVVADEHIFQWKAEE